MIFPESLIDRMDLSERMNFLTDVTAFEFLCSSEALTRLKTTAESLNDRDQRNFLRGYRLAVATALHGLLYFVADYPEALGIEKDDRFYNWLHFPGRKRQGTLLSAVSDPMSTFGRLCSVFHDLAINLRKADRSLPDTIAVIEKCGSIVKLFNQFLVGTKIVSLDTGKELPDRESLLCMCLAERVLDYLKRDRSIVTLAYELVWSGEGELRPLHDQFILHTETHLDNVALSLYTKGIPKEWLNGFWFGCALVVQLSGIRSSSLSDLVSDPLNVRNWCDEFLTFVDPPHPQGKWPSDKYGVSAFKQPNVRKLLGNFEVNMSAGSSKHRLAAILSPDRVRLIASAGATDALELKVMLSGAVAMHDHSKVRVLILTHSVDTDDRQWTSLAFRLPMYGTFTNASKWFLFYKIYHEEPVLDTEVSRAIKTVEELLLRFKDKLEVEEIDGLDAKDFLPLCTLPAFRAMRELSHRAVEANADLRSGSSELLAALWLVYQGYSNVKVAFERASLGKGDYDAIGVRDRQCLVVEVKSTKSGISDHELQDQICRFADKVDRLRGRLPELAQALECESDIESVSGLFIFSGDVNKLDTSVPSIPLWGYDDFVGALRSEGFPNKIVDLLHSSHIIRHVRLDDFPDDPFSVGL